VAHLFLNPFLLLLLPENSSLFNLYSRAFVQLNSVTEEIFSGSRKVTMDTPQQAAGEFQGQYT
jgi:hypothetical protein